MTTLITDDSGASLFPLNFRRMAIICFSTLRNHLQIDSRRLAGPNWLMGCLLVGQVQDSYDGALSLYVNERTLLIVASNTIRVRSTYGTVIGRADFLVGRSGPLGRYVSVESSIVSKVLAHILTGQVRPHQ